MARYINLHGQQTPMEKGDHLNADASASILGIFAFQVAQFFIFHV
jgi:hypothetical protein